MISAPPVALAGDGLPVPCVDGSLRPYLSFDAAASTSALPGVLDAVEASVPWYSSVHRGAGYKSQVSTAAYESARDAALAFAGREAGGGDVAILCRNTTEAINHLAYRLRASAGINTTREDVQRLLAAVARVAAGDPPVPYRRDPTTGDFRPHESLPEAATMVRSA